MHVNKPPNPVSPSKKSACHLRHLLTSTIVVRD